MIIRASDNHKRCSSSIAQHNGFNKNEKINDNDSSNKTVQKRSQKPKGKMSSIMRGDQTVSLIQQYHAHYPEIARNTQDVEGRKQRVYMWAKITEDLNAQYNTHFTVEQFKKKVQNVQCTSRQKIQSGKRNLGDAEMEYMRLFEHDRLNNVEMAAKFGVFKADGDDYYSPTSFRVAAQNGPDEEANNSIVGGIKAEFINNNNDGEEMKEDYEECSTPSTSAGCGGVASSGGGIGPLNSLFDVSTNKINGTGNNALDNAQLLLAMMANNLTTALTTPVSNNNNNSNNYGDVAPMENGNASFADSILSTLKDASSRKRNTSNILSVDNNNSITFNNNNNNNGGGIYAGANGDSGNVTAKRRRKQPHAVHLSHLRPAETMAFDLPITTTTTVTAPKPDDAFCAGASASALSKPISDEHWKASLMSTSNFPAISSTADHRWRNDVMEMQKTILDNQRRILAIIERQTTLQQEERELRARRLSASQSPPSPPLNARQLARPDSAQPDDVSGATLLATLCEKLDVLANALTSIDFTFKSHFAAADKSNSAIHQRSVQTAVNETSSNNETLNFNNAEEETKSPELNFNSTDDSAKLVIHESFANISVAKELITE